MKSDDKRFVIYDFVFCFIRLLLVISGHLNTVALRPTLFYGECDERFFPAIMRLADRWKGKIPRIAEGGKKQVTYVGEFAVHLRASWVSKIENKAAIKTKAKIS